MMPEGTAKRPAASAAAVPKGTGETAPGKLRAAGAKGSAEAAPERGRGALPRSSWQTAPRAGAPRRRDAGGGGFSAVTEEVELSGPPADPARQLSELLRVQRRMNPSAGVFGEEVL